MITTDFLPHRERLLALRARLRDDVNRMTSAALAEEKSTRMPMHMAELGSDSFDRELTLSLLGGEQNALDQIEAAITRIENGSYGRCETCGERIPEPRLQAIPYAVQCVQCAAEREGPSTSTGFGRSQHRILPR